MFVCRISQLLCQHTTHNSTAALSYTYHYFTSGTSGYDSGIGEDSGLLGCDWVLLASGFLRLEVSWCLHGDEMKIPGSFEMSSTYHRNTQCHFQENSWILTAVPSALNAFTVCFCSKQQRYIYPPAAQHYRPYTILCFGIRQNCTFCNFYVFFRNSIDLSVSSHKTS